jgi:2-dehydropantoate 2-reductase
MRSVVRRWLVVGAGGIGGYFGGLLAHAGQDVTFLARGEHLKAMREDGLRIETADRRYDIGNVRAYDAATDREPFDVVLFCVKTYDNAAAAAAVEGVVGDGTVVLSIQNGMDNDSEIQRLLPPARVYPAVAHIVSARVAPGVIRRSGGAGTVTFGDPAEPDNAVLRAVADVMRAAGIDATASSDIERARWEKFVFIVAFSGMTTLCRAPIGAVLNDPVAMRLYRRCVAEAVATARAGGVDVGPATGAAALDRTETYRGRDENATSSMLRDVLAGRPTEVESLNGAVVRRAADHGLDVPVNSAIYTGIKLATAAG